MASIILAFLFPFLANAAGTQVAFDPLLEGIYEIQITCANTPGPCDASPLQVVNRLTITDTRGKYGLWATFGASSTGEATNTFLGATAGPLPSQVSGTPMLGSGFGSSGRFAYFNCSIDPQTETLTGTVVDSHVGTTFHLIGKRIRTVKNILGGKIPLQLTSDQIVGTYHGILGANGPLNTAGTLIVTQLPDKQIIGYFNSDSLFDGQPKISFDYFIASWDADIGVMRLLFLNQGLFALGEMVLAYRLNAQGVPEFGGFQYTVFADYPATMTKLP